MRSLDREIMRLARRQHELVHRKQMHELGASNRVIHRLARDEVLTHVVGSVYSTGGKPRDRVRLLHAARLEAGPRSVVSHFASAESMRFPGIGSGRLDIVVPRDAPRSRAQLGPVHTTRDLDREDITIIDGIPHTNAARTLLDIASRLTRPHLDRCLQYACHQELTTAKEVDDLIQLVRRRGRPGIRRLLPLVEVALDLPALESWLEHHLHWLIEHSSLPQPTWQSPIELPDRTYRPDAIWPAERLIVEADGYATHATRRDLQRDAERRNRLELAGYRVLVFTYDDIVGRPTYTIAMIGTHLQQRQPH